MTILIKYITIGGEPMASYGFMNYPSQQPMFPQPSGNVYNIQTSLEVANIPAGAGITVALCMPESLMYVKTIQNGVPVFLAYKISSYNEAPSSTTSGPPIEERVRMLEQKFNQLIENGGQKNDRSTGIAVPVSTKQQPQSKWDT